MLVSVGNKANKQYNLNMFIGHWKEDPKTVGTKTSYGEGPIAYQTPGQNLTVDTPLFPFQKSSGEPYTSRDCFNIETVRERLDYYRTRAIITCGMYIFYLIFQGGVFRKYWPYLWLVFKSGLYSWACYNGAHTVISLIMEFHKTSGSLKLSKVSTLWPREIDPREGQPLRLIEYTRNQALWACI